MKKLVTLLCILSLALLASPASAYLVEVYYTGASITTLAQAESVITASGLPEASATWSVIEFDDLGDATRGHYSINNPFPGGYLTDFAVKVTGSIYIDTAGAFTFGINSDDGARLTIDGSYTGQQDGLADNRDGLISFVASAGLHYVEILYFEHGGGASLEFFGAPGTLVYDFNQLALIQSAPVPEPATMLLLASGLAGLAGLRRKFKK